jgi:hypothetical protein
MKDKIKRVCVREAVRLKLANNFSSMGVNYREDLKTNIKIKEYLKILKIRNSSMINHMTT